jgi:hypothetical protein
MVPRHVGNVGLTGQGKGSVINTESLGHVDGWSPNEIEERLEG